MGGTRHRIKHHGYGRDLHAAHARVAGTLDEPTILLEEPTWLDVSTVTLIGEHLVVVTGTRTDGQPVTLPLDTTTPVVWHTIPNGDAR